MRNLPPMSTLRAFEATARTGSVTRAAEELFRTHGAISRQLRQLQEHAGVELFERDGTGVRLNEHGRAFHDVVRVAFDQLEQGYARVLDQARGARSTADRTTPASNCFQNGNKESVT